MLLKSLRALEENGKVCNVIFEKKAGAGRGTFLHPTLASMMLLEEMLLHAGRVPAALWQCINTSPFAAGRYRCFASGNISYVLMSCI